MNTRTILLTLLLACSIGATASAQLPRANERTWHALRGGLFLGVNHSRYSGDVPFRPFADNSLFGDGSGTNFTFGIQFEKALSRIIVLGIRASFDPMTGTVDQNVTEIGRVSDSQGNLYDVERDKSVEYILRYFSIGGYGKLYPGGGPGFFIGTGLTVSALMRDHFTYSNTVTSPEWARGAVAPTESGEIEKVNPLRISIDAALGYEFFFSYGFISPEIHYDIGLSNVIDASYADTWSINNIRGVLAINFPLP